MSEPNQRFAIGTRVEYRNVGMGKAWMPGEIVRFLAEHNRYMVLVDVGAYITRSEESLRLPESTPDIPLQCGKVVEPAHNLTVCEKYGHHAWPDVYCSNCQMSMIKELERVTKERDAALKQVERIQRIVNFVL